MKLYNNYFASNYDELITYYPRYYQKVLEMQAILKAQGKIADKLENSIEQVYHNCFIDEADEEMITRLEKFLKIEMKKFRPLEERKQLVKTYFIGFGKLSASLICKMIETFMDAPVGCRLEPFDKEGNNRLYIDFKKNIDENVDMRDAFSLLSKKIPAHIQWLISICYNIMMLEKVSVEVPLLTISSNIFRKKSLLLDTSCLLDKTYPIINLLDSDIEIIITQKCRVELDAKSDATLLVEKDLWYLDGRIPLDGGRILDAEVYTIDIS